MLFKTTAGAALLAACSTIIFASSVHAADADEQPTSSQASNTNSATGRYGLLDGLDHRSAYTQDVFVEPFLVPDTALEDNEVELNWLHSRAGAKHTDIGSVELQEGIGLLTLEAELPYVRMTSPDRHSINGMGSIDLGARYPFYQYVSANQMIDTTFGLSMEGELPVDTTVTRNGELDPSVFNALILGHHLTLQSTIGYSQTTGPGDNGGEESLEYGFSFAYVISHRELPLPGVAEFVPMVEISGERGLNQDEAGQDSVAADIGFRAQMKTVGELHSSIGFAWVLPLDNGEREELHWGFIISTIFDF